MFLSFSCIYIFIKNNIDTVTVWTSPLTCFTCLMILIHIPKLCEGHFDFFRLTLFTRQRFTVHSHSIGTACLQSKFICQINNRIHIQDLYEKIYPFASRRVESLSISDRVKLPQLSRPEQRGRPMAMQCLCLYNIIPVACGKFQHKR